MGILGTAKAALAAVSGELTTLREQRKAKHARLSEIDGQVQALREAPISLEDFQGYIASFVARSGSAFGQSIRLRDGVKANRGTGYDLHVPVYQTPWSRFEDEDGNTIDSAVSLPDRSSLLGGGDAFGAWCFFAPELVAQKLTEQLRKDAGNKWVPPDAPSVAERRVLIAQLAQQRGAVEDGMESVTQSIAEIETALGGESQRLS